MSLKPNGFRLYLFFNRFRVVWLEGGHAYVEFGLVVEQKLAHGYACVLAKDVLDNVRDSLLKFYERLPHPEEAKLPSWSGLPGPCPVEAPLIVGMAHSDNVAEITFCGVATWLAAKAVRVGARAVEADPLTVLRCDLALQRRLIEDLCVKDPSDED